ncbi:sensor histidine kinase [Sphingomonas mollis]|uniref:histidine kinase n=1 Tax=Sphingomonas mollis TaxID=2795726 RepID=A0ABS0XTJ9_9SPHN|nr:ATP-binding protein [Sphingomonas sp. BT553]MBJ6123366.1 histidine kinase [Sphingomonas sp. BT553]
MGSDARAIVRAIALFAAGIVAAIGWVHGLYATAALAVIAALWIGAAAHHVARRRASPPPPPSPLPVGDDARERRRLAAYLDLSPAPLVALDARDRLHAVNRAARRLLVADDLVALPPAALVEAIGAAVPGRAASVRIDTEKGVHTFAILTTDLTGSGMATRVAALIDIDSEMKAVEAQALRDLLQVLSHEITNTLTPIASLARTAAQILEDGDAERDTVHDAVETVARRAEALQRFVEAYRAMARLPVPALAPVHLAPLVADISRLFDTRWPAASLTLDLRAAPATVRVDADQLIAALWALLQNAAEVAVAVTLDIRTTVGAVEFMVGDDGPGIPAANGDAIFQPFFTTKPQGSGVGLALARQIFRAHGGDLVLFAVQPARFLATLPI